MNPLSIYEISLKSGSRFVVILDAELSMESTLDEIQWIKGYRIINRYATAEKKLSNIRTSEIEFYKNTNTNYAKEG